MAFSPRAVLEAQQGYKKIIEENPALALFSAWPQMWTAQKRLAEFLNARPQDLFLRPNVTVAMNDFIMALELPPNSEIIISDIEYGAIINICRYKAEKEGHTLKIVGGGESFLANLKQAVGPKTKLVMVSHVTTGSGFVFPIEEIAAFCRQKNIFFAVDGAHGAGSMPLDFSKTEVDFYGSNLHKWMMGPKGTGFGWVSPKMRPHLKPQFAGWTTYDVQPHFQAFGGGDEWTVRWMICSTVQFADYYAISDTIQFWQTLGAAQIQKRQRELRDFCASEVTRKTGWVCLSDQVAPAFRGPMVAFALPAALANRGFELIFLLKEKHQLLVSMTMIHNTWCLRLAPHIYNTEAEITQAAGVLASLR